MYGCGWPRGGVGRQRGLHFYLKLPLLPLSPPSKGQVRCGVTWGVRGQSFSVPLSDVKGRVFPPPKLDLPRWCLSSSPFALLFPQPRGLGGSRVLRPLDRPPGCRAPDPRPLPPPAPLAMGIGAGGGAGSLSGLALGVRVPSLSLASSLSISFSFE